MMRILGSVTGLLLIAASALGAAVIVNIFPYSTASSILASKAGPLEWLHLVIAGCALPLSIAAFVVSKALASRRRSRPSAFDKPFDPFANETCLAIRAPIAAILCDIPVRYVLRGDPDRITDHGGALSASPLQARGIDETGRSVHEIIIPAAFWKRFATHPRALGAVLAHEAAHIANRDITLLFDTARFVRVIGIFAVLAAVVSVVLSVKADIASSGPVSIREVGLATWAALAGKGYAQVALILVGLIHLVVKQMTIWREALADHVAVDSFGEDALAAAERLVAGDDSARDRQVRARAAMRDDAILGNAALIVLYGAAIGSASDYLAGPLAYASGFLLRSENAQALAAVAGEWIVGLWQLIGLVLLSRLIPMPVTSKQGLQRLATALSWASAGMLLAHLLTQVLPLTIASTAMPPGYDYVIRHEPLSLLVKSVLTTGIDIAALAALAWLSLVLTKCPLGARLAPALIWVVVRPIERNFLPEFASGGVAATLVLAALMLLIICSLHYRVAGVSTHRTTLMLGGLALLPLTGATLQHVAATMERSGALRLSRGEDAASERVLDTAARLMPLQGGAAMKLAVVRFRRGDADAAIAAAEQAAAAPLTSAWQDILEAKLLLGDLYLHRRRGGDVPRALALYRECKQMWRSNSRLDRGMVASLLYNFAAAQVSTGGISATALLALAEAITLKSDLAAESLKDPDFAMLELHKPGPAPSADFLRTLSALRLRGPVEIEAALDAGRIAPDQTVAYLRGYIARSASAAR